MIPLRALANGGDAAIRYFADRLVARGMLSRGSSMRSTIVNTALR